MKKQITGFGNRLKELRVKQFGETHGVNILSSKMKISEDLYRKYETEFCNMPIEKISKLFDITRVNLNWLLLGEGPMLEQDYH